MTLSVLQRLGLVVWLSLVAICLSSILASGPRVIPPQIGATVLVPTLGLAVGAVFGRPARGLDWGLKAFLAIVAAFGLWLVTQPVQ